MADEIVHECRNGRPACMRHMSALAHGTKLSWKETMLQYLGNGTGLVDHAV